ncbi:MAG TPA: hypothetical protein PK156_07880 [Polyangium sp.]|nr:hypothetical protein [Polyangium sp.]
MSSKLPNTAMDTVHFVPRCQYTIVPRKWTYRYSLGLIERWRNLGDVVRFAQERRGYGDTDWGCGIEYPTRPERRGFVRVWRWQWLEKNKIRTRKFHFPEADYLATLAALLRVNGRVDEAATIAQIMALPNVDLLPVADPYDISNYGFNVWSREIQHASRLIVEQESFALAAERAAAREGFVLRDGSGVSYAADGNVVLHLPHDRTSHLAEADYLKLVGELGRAASRACHELEKALSMRTESSVFGVADSLGKHA